MHITCDASAEIARMLELPATRAALSESIDTKTMSAAAALNKHF